jgi:hypothetical protein
VHPELDYPPARGRQRGRPRTKGARIGTPAELAAAGPGRTAPVTRYGKTASVSICERRCLWPGVFRSRPVRVIAVTEPGSRLVLVTTDMATPAGQIITRYAGRWAIEPIADWLAHHDVGSVNGSLHETALDNARGRLLTLGAGLFAAGALWFTGRSFTLSREGQVTDRYTKAIEQLGSDKLDVRIGGTYALERVARDSAEDHPTVMEVLTAFIRVHSFDRPSHDHPTRGDVARETRNDVQAAITVIARRASARDIRAVDITGAHLPGANLIDARFGAARLVDVNLEEADFTGANLAGADLAGATLTDANLDGADLYRADLSGARWPENAPVPEGWKLDTGSGRLERAGTDSGPTEAN